MNLRLFILLFLGNFSANGQILLNEICSANQTLIQDEFGKTPDWAELYNAGNETVNLEGWFLSDEADEPDKWKFPNIEIGAGELLLIFASDEDLVLEYIHTNFKISSEGEKLFLSNPNLEIIDEIFVPELNADFSFGRKTDGDSEWKYFENPTPNESNSEGVFIEKMPKPTFSVQKHFHQNPIQILLECDRPDCEIRFTRDGNLPNENSELFDSFIQIDTTTAIRAAAFSDGFLPSEIETKTIFINENHILPVVSVTSEPANFFDWESGIFVAGPDADPKWPFWGANFWKDTEFPAHVEFFDEKENPQIAFDITTAPHGGRGARTRPQKPLRFIADKTKNLDKIEFPFFDHKDIDAFTRLVLRNSSGDFNRSHFRDGFLGRKVIRDGLNIDALAYQPTVLYINGAYWGVMNLREKGDRFFVESNYGIPADEIDFLEANGLIGSGDNLKFLEDYDFIINTDLSIESNFQTAAKLFDIPSYIDYFAAQFSLVNTDWPQNNVKFWCERTPDGRWRYLFFDLDSSTGNNSWNTASFDSMSEKMEKFGTDNLHINILKAFLKNEGFKIAWLNRFADLLNTSFRPEIFSREALEMKEFLRPEMPRHFARWDFCSECKSYEEWDNRHSLDMVRFAEERAPFARQFILDYFNLDNEIELELNVWPPNAGKIQINTVTPELPWNGWYFNGIPVTLTAIPNPGFEFSHWGTLRLFEKNESEQLTLNFANNESVTAFFEGKYEGLNLLTNPNPAQNSTVISYELNKRQNVRIQFFDAVGRLIFEESKFQNGGVQKKELDLSHLSSGVYFIKIESEAFSEIGKILIID